MTEPTEKTDPPSPVAPRWLPTTLVVVATLIAVLSTLTTWVRTQALDTDEWVSTSSELLDDDEIRESLAVYLGNELFEVVDVEAELDALLPDALAPLAGPLAGAIRGPATNGIERLLASERFAELWATSNRVAHEKLVAILRDETVPVVSTDDGKVTLELGELVRSVGENLGLPDSALDRISPDAGQITIFESDELATAQTTVRILDFLSWFVFLVVVALYVLAVWLALGRRMTMLRNIGVALLLGGIAVLLMQSLGVRITVGAVVQNSANEPAARVIGQVATELLRQLGWTGITYGLLIILFTFLVGDHRWAVGIRRSVGGATEGTVAVVGGTVMLLLVLFWWNPGDAYDRWISALTLTAGVIAGITVFVMKVRAESIESGSIDGGAATPVEVESG